MKPRRGPAACPGGEPALDGLEPEAFLQARQAHEAPARLLRIKRPVLRGVLELVAERLFKEALRGAILRQDDIMFPSDWR